MVSQQMAQPVEKGSVELTKEHMSFPVQKILEEGEASENNTKEERIRDNQTMHT